MFQRTIKNPVSIEGFGIHTGKNIKVLLKPSKENTGITFIRTDIAQRPVVAANISNIMDSSKSMRRTSISAGSVEVHTIEHLLASLCAFEIDNVIAEVSGPELPGLDGSAEGFVKAVKAAGATEQKADRKTFYIKEPVWVSDKDSAIIILPDVNFKISYTLDYPTTNIKSQYSQFIINKEIFENEIAPSRTFCLQEEIEHLKGLGLGKGASLENTIVVGKEGIIGGKLKFDDELLRHKVLDLIGDLYLLGYPIKAHIIAIKSGHNLNLQILKKIAEQKQKIEGLPNVPQKDTNAPIGIMDLEQIQKILPHRYPFLMIDRILQMSESMVVGIKKLSDNDYFFAGHFPGVPVMPGVLILEALAQTAGVLMLSRADNRGKIAYFMSVNNAKFRRIVKPGDTLRLEIEVVKFKTKTGQVHGNAFVGENLVAEADLMFIVNNK